MPYMLAQCCYADYNDLYKSFTFHNGFLCIPIKTEVMYWGENYDFVCSFNMPLIRRWKFQ